MKTTVLFIIGSVLFTTAINANATRDDFYIYTGISKAIYQSSSTDLDLGIDEISDDDGYPYDLSLGASFNRFLGVEISYLDGAGLSGDVILSNSPIVTLDRDHDMSGLSLVFVPKLPVGIVSFYGKLGVMRWDLEESVGSLKESDSGISLVYGVGISIELGRHVALTGEYKEMNIDAEMFNQDEAYESSIFSVGLRIAF